MATARPSLKASPRTITGKHVARLRSAGQLPAAVHDRGQLAGAAQTRDVLAGDRAGRSLEAGSGGGHEWAAPLNNAPRSAEREISMWRREVTTMGRRSGRNGAPV